MYSIDIKKFDETSFFNSWVQTHAPQKFAITKPSGWASGVHIFSYTVFRNISPQKSKRYLKSQICEFMSKMHLYPKINNLTKKKKKKKKKIGTKTKNVFEENEFHSVCSWLVKPN